MSESDRLHQAHALLARLEASRQLLQPPVGRLLGGGHRMTALFLVREEAVPVEQLVPGDRLILPNSLRVTVERVDEFDDGLVVRWWRPAERGEPGHRGGKQHALAVGDEWNGRYLGSTVAFPAGHCLMVDRG